MQMMTAMPDTPLFSALALTCAGLGSYHDLRERRIPNRLTGPAIAGALLLHLLFGGWAACLGALAAAVVAGAVTCLFFLAGGMGAGDVKLMVAVGAFLGLGSLPRLLLAVGICGGVFALGIALRHGRLLRTIAGACALIGHHRRRGLAPHPEHNLGAEGALRMPYALPIFAGCLLTAMMPTWSN